MSNVKTAAVTAAVLLAVVAAFQIALVAGAPWGRMSYGGQAETVDGVLPGSYRVMSAAAVLILLFAAWIVLARARVVSRGILSPGFLGVAAWVIFAYLILNTAMNLTSSHAGERFGMGAITLISAAACFIVARGRADLVASG
jgi:thiosulfate reductase cytochrome b subunit